MEERSKEEILSELYAIRAAMSLVSERQTATKKNQKEIEGSNEKIKFDLESLRKASAEIDNKRNGFLVANKIQDLTAQQAALKRARDELQKSIYESQADIKYFENQAKKQYKPAVPAIFFGIILAISFVIMLFVGWSNPFPDLTDSEQNALCIGLAAGIPVLLTIIFALIYHAIVIQPNSWDRKCIEGHIAKMQNTQQEIYHLESSINQLDNEISRQNMLAKRGARYYDEKSVEELNQRESRLKTEQRARENEEKQFILTKQSNITALAKESQEIIENARGLYTVIDFRDWANVDLIIFYYETGRADTMKEALQQVDRQRQNETLVKAVGMATEMIAKTILQSIGSLKNTLDHSFRKLSVQLEFQHQKSLEQVSKLGAELEAKLGEQAEELRLSAEAQARVQAANQEMTNALLKKINVSSTQLAYDMDVQMKLVHHIVV